MATFTQASSTVQVPALYTEPVRRVFGADAGASDPQAYPQDDIVSAGAVTLTDDRTTITTEEFPALFIEQSSGGFEWFENFHVIEREYAFGNILSDQSSAIEVFSAFRTATRIWTSFTNNAGAGTELSGSPTLPANVLPMSGEVMTLEVSSTGQAFVDALLVFLFDSGTINVPITIKRIVLWGLEPEVRYEETLASLTDVQTSTDGTELRQALRDSPEQSWKYSYIIQEGTEQQILENLLFEYQSRTFGVPVWFEDSALTAAGAVDDTTITVNSTAFRDYRVAGLAIILTDQSTFDVLPIASFTTTTLTFSSPLTNAYAIGTKVYPLAVCTAQPVLTGMRPPVGISRIGIQFDNTENDVDLDSTSSFSTYNSKVLLDNGNSVFGEVSETFQQEFIVIDSGSGLKSVSSLWDNHKRGHTFSLRADGREAVWQMRGLLHALKGRFTSLYVPRNRDDLEVVTDLAISSLVMVITNVGYVEFVRSRQPKNVIRLTKTDGTVLLRGIASSTSIDSSTEQLTVDSVWPTIITVAEIERVEYVEKVRLDTDDIRIRYDRDGHRAHMIAPVKVVLE